MEKIFTLFKNMRERREEAIELVQYYKRRLKYTLVIGGSAVAVQLYNYLFTEDKSDAPLLAFCCLAAVLVFSLAISYAWKIIHARRRCLILCGEELIAYRRELREAGIGASNDSSVKGTLLELYKRTFETLIVGDFYAKIPNEGELVATVANWKTLLK